MKLSKMREAVEAFVVLTSKAGSTLDQLKETAEAIHDTLEAAEIPTVSFHVKKAFHSFSSVVDSLEKIDSALTNLQAHVHQGVSRVDGICYSLSQIAKARESQDKAMLDKIRNVAFNPKYTTEWNQALPLIRKILRHDGVEDWTVKPAEHIKLTPADIANAFQAPASMMNEALGGKANVTTINICHICQEEARYTDLDTGKFLCGKHSPLVLPL